MDFDLSDLPTLSQIFTPQDSKQIKAKSKRKDSKTPDKSDFSFKKEKKNKKEKSNDQVKKSKTKKSKRDSDKDAKKKKREKEFVCESPKRIWIENDSSNLFESIEALQVEEGKEREERDKVEEEEEEDPFLMVKNETDNSEDSKVDQLADFELDVKIVEQNDQKEKNESNVSDLSIELEIDQSTECKENSRTLEHQSFEPIEDENKEDNQIGQEQSIEELKEELNEELKEEQRVEPKEEPKPKKSKKPKDPGSVSAKEIKLVKETKQSNKEKLPRLSEPMTIACDTAKDEPHTKVNKRRRASAPEPDDPLRFISKPKNIAPIGLKIGLSKFRRVSTPLHKNVLFKQD